MTLRSIFFSLSTLFLLSCSVDKNKKEGTTAATDSTATATNSFMVDCIQLKKEAKHMDSILLQQLEMDEAAAKKAITAFMEFGTRCERDTLAPVFLIKTAQVARAINNIPQAKRALDHCIATFPNFKDKPAAMFLLAQLYDEPTYLNNEDEARTLYQRIIDGYPASPWASSAKGAILFLGKSDKQIMDELKKKQK